MMNLNAETEAVFVLKYSTIIHMIKEELSNAVPTLPNFIIKDILKLLEYTVLGGKMLRGKLSIATFECLRTNALQYHLEDACMIAWAIEITQAFFLVADDIMDASLVRRGKSCWYKHVGLNAINDSILLESLAFFILKKQFYNRPEILLELLLLFKDVIFKTSLGQALDLKCDSIPVDPKVESHSALPTFYTFYLPIKAAIILAGIKINEDALMPIILNLGEWFQIQDDYLDCFGDSKITGKVGTDIQDHKLSWCYITAMQGGDPDHILKNNYGKEFGVDIIRSYYQELNLPLLYAQESFKRKELLENLISKTLTFPLELQSLLFTLTSALSDRIK